MLANKYFTDRSPIGQRLVVDDVDGDPRPVEIVGVVGQVKQSSLEAAAEADIYLPLRQVPKDGIPWLRSSSYWVIKTSPAAPAVEPLVRAEIRNADPADLTFLLQERLVTASCAVLLDCSEGQRGAR